MLVAPQSSVGRIAQFLQFTKGRPKKSGSKPAIYEQESIALKSQLQKDVPIGYPSASWPVGENEANAESAFGSVLAYYGSGSLML